MKAHTLAIAVSLTWLSVGCNTNGSDDVESSARENDEADTGAAPNDQSELGAESSVRKDDEGDTGVPPNDQSELDDGIIIGDDSDVHREKEAPKEIIARVSVDELGDEYRFVQARRRSALAEGPAGPKIVHFSSALCEVTVQAVPDEFREYRLILGSNFLLACDQEGCSLLELLEERIEQVAGSELAGSDWSRVHDDGRDSEQICVSSSEELRCFRDQKWTEALELESSVPLAVSGNCVYFESNKACYLDGKWQSAQSQEQSDPLLVGSGCESDIDLKLSVPMRNFLYGASQSGQVMRAFRAPDGAIECASLSMPLGRAVGFGLNPCALSINPVLTTADAMYTSCSCPLD